MTPEETKARFDDLASRIWGLREELIPLHLSLTREDDKKAFRRISTDLMWATENCTVLGLHQVGQALDDNMGTKLPP